MQICRHADGKKWAIPYPDLRLLLNVDSPKKKGSTESKQRIRANSVPRYHEFRRRVLDVARDELAPYGAKIIRQTIISPIPRSSRAIAIPRQAILFLTYTRHIRRKKDLDAYENHLSPNYVYWYGV